MVALTSPMKTKFAYLLVPLIVVVSLFPGCTSYIPPGPKADLQAFAPASIQEGFAAKPASSFPVGIAAVRVQGPAYSNHRLRHGGGQYGEGRYCVIMTREVEEQAHFDRIGGLPQVSGVTGLNRMLLPAKLDGDRELREAAARLQADLVLIYTFDTAFFDHDAAKPLTVISLGLSPTRRITAATTVSALLLDTRTGYLYSAYEVTERQATLATSWGSGDAADAVRLATEKRAFAKLVDEFAASWPKLLERHARPAGAVGAAF